MLELGECSRPPKAGACRAKRELWPLLLTGWEDEYGTEWGMVSGGGGRSETSWVCVYKNGKYSIKRCKKLYGPGSRPSCVCRSRGRKQDQIHGATSREAGDGQTLRACVGAHGFL